ncbi:MAG: ABC transporter permease subunit [bacterium]|nr:ABC transporter permease subunit [bacterium]
MISMILDAVKKMYRRPFYRLLMFVLGLPTFVVTFVVYLMHNSGINKKQKLENARQEILARMKADGTLEKMKRETEGYLKNKRAFFGSKENDSELAKQVEKAVQKETENYVNKKLQENKELQDLIKKTSFINVFEALMGNMGFVVFSVITSIPFYILALIYANPYGKYILERLLMMIFVVFGVVFLVFTILHMSPMDPAVNILGQTATQDQIVEFNRIYGLDKPYIVQLVQVFKNILTFDLGNSYQGNEVVFDAIMRRFPITLELTIASLIVAIAIAIPAGIISAVKQYSSFDYIFMLLALLGLSIPNFWLGLILILNWSINMDWLPATYSPDNWKTLIMPAIVLGTGLSASVARMTRSSMLEVINADYIVTARAKGLSKSKVVLKHALGNAMIPIVTVIGLQFGGMLGGSAVTEKVFNVNGIGSYIVDKQFVPDIPVVLAGVVYVAIIISIANLLVDILYAFLDPRIKSKIKSS